MRLVMIVALAGIVAGCASPSSVQFSVQAGRYAGAVDATRDVLRGDRVSMERVEVAGGGRGGGWRGRARCWGGGRQEGGGAGGEPLRRGPGGGGGGEPGSLKTRHGCWRGHRMMARFAGPLGPWVGRRGDLGR